MRPSAAYAGPFLCGDDPYSGQSYEHRRYWIRARLEFLASIFGIDCLTYTVLSNHLHIVLRSRPDIVNTWTDEEIARRWLRLFPKRKKKDGSPAAPSASELHMITADQERLKELRSRLSDISWWMRCTSENIAKQANREDECTGPLLGRKVSSSTVARRSVSVGLCRLR